MASLIQSISPIDGHVVAERPAATWSALESLLDRADQAARHWRNVPLDQRMDLCRRFIHCVVEKKGQLAREITEQMGRPIRYAAGEITGFEERGLAMIDVAESALSSIVPTEKPGFERWIQREPLGVVLVLAAWNYPYLIAVNSIIPALLSGNVVMLKHAEQTLLCAERLAEAAREAGLPGGVFQVVHMSHEVTARVVADSRVAFVSFTGSERGGRAVHGAAGGHLKAVGLELGGKDPAYVCADADLEVALESLVDGAFFNSGQSCCGVERIYVHQSRYVDFVEGFTALTNAYVLGDPRETETTLGPVVRPARAAEIQSQIDDALHRGATALIDPGAFPQLGPCFMPPQVLVDVDHSMRVMREETFGPVVGLSPVGSDEEAIDQMNDSVYGLTASLWTSDVERARAMGQQLQTGTVFLNRCDYLDPELAWVGAKLSGRGASLSRVGFEQLTRPKSFHFRLLE
jgi:acyl-CoA reductase-like NAD-dependent aldehyde dehydrogenase